jgi:hypothetical protein
MEEILHLPFSIYTDIPQWALPLRMDERTSLSPKQFPFYKHSHASFFIAYEKNRDVKVLSPNIKEGIKNI